MHKPDASHCQLQNDGRFLIENYQQFPPFTNFLPGIAGLWGTPLWAYYVNRGQCMATFGTLNKNQSILEFQSANLHYKRVNNEGFRTFIRGERKGKPFLYEPFRYEQKEFEVKNRLWVSPYDLQLEEDCITLGIRVHVDYFTLANEAFPALVRRLHIENLDPEESLKAEVCDGIPNILPFGVSHDTWKQMPFITDGYITIDFPSEDLAFYSLGNVPGDESETEFVHSGHFYYGLLHSKKDKASKVIFDPKVVFGDYNDRAAAYAISPVKKFEFPEKQDKECQSPCAFSYFSVELKAGESISHSSFTGLAWDRDFARSIPSIVTKPAYIEDKQKENQSITQQIQDVFFLNSKDQALNHYVQHCFLDNSLRGGLPIRITAGAKEFFYHVYSRKHGDLERDYNFFQLDPSYFSQGNGNFRDVNQNRRNDVWFLPELADSNVKFFFNLLQLDGYNPLLIEGAWFRLKEVEQCRNALESILPPDSLKKLIVFLQHRFTPGSLFVYLREQKIEVQQSEQQFLEIILSHCEQGQRALFGHGYWSDHWVYNFDLLDAFEAIFPDKIASLLLYDKGFSYRDTHVLVRPRAEKHALNPAGEVRLLFAIEPDTEKLNAINQRSEAEAASQDRVRVRNFLNSSQNREDSLANSVTNLDSVYQTNLCEKLLCLFINKMATLSPSGIGIEMDGGRPGWCDSVNGLPGLFGAGTPEVYQLLRAMQWLENAIQTHAAEDYTQTLPKEIYDFYSSVLHAIKEWFAKIGQNSEKKLPQGATQEVFAEEIDKEVDVVNHQYYKQVNEAKEKFRKETHWALSGETKTISVQDVLEFLTLSQKKLWQSHRDTVHPTAGIPITYVTHQATKFDIRQESHDVVIRNQKGYPLVEVQAWKRHYFAPFLEAPIYRMALGNQEEAQKLRQDIRKSPLFDQKLERYKISSDLDKESPEQGRTGGWGKAWFENESVFSHVEFKFLLQLLKSGLYEEFFSDIQHSFPIFLNAKVYGRSPLENVSFVVSSAGDRESFHGRGLQPRLSGSNAELVHMFLILSFGKSPFRYESDKLSLAFQPVLPEWMFTDYETSRQRIDLWGKSESINLPANSYTALFLGKTLVTYLNPERKATFGKDAVQVVSYTLVEQNGSSKELKGQALNSDLAVAIRKGQYRQIFVSLASRK